MVAVPVTARIMAAQQAAPPQASTEAPSAATSLHEASGYPTPGSSAAAMNMVVPDAVAQTEAHFFHERQAATLRRLCEVLMPPLNGYPGAVQAGVPEFLDFLTSVSPTDRQQMYRAGLDRLDKEANQRFGVTFAQASSEQADKLLRPLMGVWGIGDHPPADHPPSEPFMRFINIAHQDIRTATINSQIWSEAAVASGERAPGVDSYWPPIDPHIEMYV